MLGLPDTVRACLFDLDGVLTDTASVHRKAWKAMFDAYLRDRAQRTGEPFVPFDIAGDYLTYIDGKKREDGVRSFLAARDITLPEGDPGDDPSAETVHGLGNRKNELFHHTIREEGVKVFEGSRRYLEASPPRVWRSPSCRRAPTPARCSRSPGSTNSSSSGWTA